MEELPDKTLPFTLDSLEKTDEQVFLQSLENGIDLIIKKEETTNMNTTKLPNWDMFYHNLPLKSFVPESLQARNFCILKTYRCQEEGILYIYRAAGQDELWLTLWDMKTMTILSDFTIPMAFSIDTLVKIKACKTAFIVFDSNFITVFRIEERARVIELFRHPNMGMILRLIKLNDKYLCLGIIDLHYPSAISLKVWDLNKVVLLRSVPWNNPYQCWFIRDKFFILSWDWVTWRLSVHDLSRYNGEYRTIFTGQCSEPRSGKIVQMCPPYLIILVSEPENSYLFFNCETLLSEFYLPLSDHNIRKFYLAKDKFIAITFTIHSILLFFSSQVHKTELEMFGTNFRGSAYQDLKLVNLSSRKITGKIYSNDWTICVPGGVFWVPSSNLCRLIDVCCNVAIYLQDKFLRFVTPITPPSVPKIWDINQIQRELESEDLPAIYKLRQLGDFELAHKMDLIVPSYNVFYSLLDHRKIPAKHYQPISDMFPSNLNLTMFQNKEFCIQTVRTIQSLTSQDLPVNEHSCTEKAMALFFEYLDQIFELSKFGSNSRRWINRIKDYIDIVISIDDEMKTTPQTSFQKKWALFLSTYQTYFELSYGAFLIKKSSQIMKNKQYFSSITSLNFFNAYQLFFDDFCNLDQPTHYGNFYANAAKKIFEKQYNDLRKYLADRDTSAHLPNLTTPYEDSVHSSINYWKDDLDVQKGVKKQSPDQTLSYNYEKEWNPCFDKSLPNYAPKGPDHSSVKNAHPYIMKFGHNPENPPHCPKCQTMYSLLGSLSNRVRSAPTVKELDNASLDLRKIETDTAIHFTDHFTGAHNNHIMDLIKNRIKTLQKELEDRVIYLICADSILSDYGAELQGIENGDIFDIHIGAKLEEMKINLTKYLDADRDRYTVMISQIEALLKKVDYITISKPDKSPNDMDYDLGDGDWEDLEEEEEIISDEEEEEEEQ